MGQLQPGEEVPHPLMTSFMPYKNGFAQALGLWVYSSYRPFSLPTLRLKTHFITRIVCETADAESSAWS